MTVPIERLERVNRELRDAGVEQRKRPWEALRRFSQEFGICVSMPSPIAEEVFDWFKSHSKPGVHLLGGVFDGVYYFDAEFWSVWIPIVFGTVALNAVDSLCDMPDSVRKNLMSNPQTGCDYTVYWADCLDYGMGVAEVGNMARLDGFGRELVRAGDQELRSAIAQLKGTKRDARAILSCRMATESFLKAYIALKCGLAQIQAKELGHNLKEAFDRFIEVSGYEIWKPLKSKLAVYPPVHGRYERQDVPPSTVWEGLALAQSIGTVIAGEHTGRDMAAGLLAQARAQRRGQ